MRSFQKTEHVPNKQKSPSKRFKSLRSQFLPVLLRLCGRRHHFQGQSPRHLAPGDQALGVGLLPLQGFFCLFQALFRQRKVFQAEAGCKQAGEGGGGMEAGHLLENVVGAGMLQKKREIYFNTFDSLKNNKSLNRQNLNKINFFRTYLIRFYS